MSFFRRQELCRDLSSQKTRLRSIVEGLQKQYTEIPADLSQHLRQVELSLQRAEEKVTRHGAKNQSPLTCHEPLKSPLVCL